MAINIIMIIVSIFVVASLALWLFSPGIRAWIESPKYQPILWHKYDKNNVKDKEF